jgi:hypothetical protein
MQRLVYLYTGTSRFVQVVGINQLKNSKLLTEKSNVFSNSNILTLKRCLATKNKNTDGIDTHPDLYKPSTAKKPTHVSDDLHSGQSPETFDTNVNNPLAAGSKVWSAQNPGSVHVASLDQAQSTKFVPKSTAGGATAHETTVYTAKGKLNIADPFKTHKLQAEPTSAQLAEAAAASAFETFAPDTPPKSASTTEVVFAPKISSKNIYSETSSPTAHFDTAVPTSSQPEPIKYETARRPIVFGGQDTSSDTKKTPKANPFDLKEQNKPRQAK